MKNVLFKIRRQEKPGAQPYWELFDLKFTEGLTVVQALEAIQKRPLNADGRAVTPVVWSQACQGAQCTSCFILINGKPRAACQTLVKDLFQPISLEPLSKFPVIRDLVVDCSRVDQDTKRLHAWNELDAYHNTMGHRNPSESSESNVDASRCTSCGACLEACPQYHVSSAFVGPRLLLSCQQHLQQTRSSDHKRAMLEALAADGGVFDCCNVQNCQRVCPQKINITETIGLLKRAVLKGAVKRFLG